MRGVDMEFSASLVLVSLQKHVNSLLLQNSIDLVTSHSFLCSRFVGELLDSRRKSGNGIWVDFDKGNHIDRLSHM